MRQGISSQVRHAKTKKKKKFWQNKSQENFSKVKQYQNITEKIFSALESSLEKFIN